MEPVPPVKLAGTDIIPTCNWVDKRLGIVGDGAAVPLKRCVLDMESPVT